jgi:uncharacterized protein YkwD
MSSLLRRLALLAAFLPFTSLLLSSVGAASDASDRPPMGASEKILFDAANRDRASQGLQPLHWDNALANAARAHAQQMAQRNTLSHQFPGEPSMQQRASQAGARFSMVAENVALGPNVAGLHTQWMNSAPHRANLLDPQLNSIGIAVVQSGNSFFAVEDFSTAVASMNVSQQEQKVAAQLAAKGLNPVNITDDARKACRREHGLSVRPAAMMRYETSDLSQLPDEVVAKLQSGQYHSAAVAACPPMQGDGSDFSSFRIAILLF